MDLFDSSYDISHQDINFGKDNKPFNFFMFVIVLIVFFILLVPWATIDSSKIEKMSGGTLTQLFANDSQDVYLKSNVDKLATGNFDLYWNQPTRVANTYMNRGTPLPTFILPDTPENPNPFPISASNNYTDYIMNKTQSGLFPNPLFVNTESDGFKKKLTKSTTLNPPNPPNPQNPPNPHELVKVAKQVAQTQAQSDNLPPMTKWTSDDYLTQTLYNNLLYNKNCIKDPGACGGGSGGFRLGEDFVQATKAVGSVPIGDRTFYPDSYVGSYFTEPGFDIVKPYPFMPDKNIV
jgi:hypothetical protein